MQLLTRSAWLALGLVVAILAPRAVAAQQTPLDVVAADRIRIQAHLERVEAALRAADVSHLSAAQHRARATNLERLRAYRLRGEFPHGSSAQPGPRVPTFIDADGRPCAMGHLVIESGHRDVADAIARDQLYARVPEITHPSLAPWLDANGMTLAEAALVQPSYCFEGCPDAGMVPVCGSDGYVYQSACIAECEGVAVVGEASCEGATCTCDDGGTPVDDAGTPAPLDGGTDAGRTVPALDAGGGGTVAPRGGCTIGAASSDIPWALAPLAIATLLATRRRR